MVASPDLRQRLFVSVGSKRHWAAWLDGERVAEFHYEREAEASPVGNIYLGRVIRVKKGLGAAFLDIGMKEAAFLPTSDADAVPVEGSAVIVQIEREGLAGKGPRVTTKVGLAGAHLVMQPGRRTVSVSERITDGSERSRLLAAVGQIAEAGEGFTVRTAASGLAEPQLREEAARLQATWRALASRAVARPPVLLYREPPLDLRLLRDWGSRFDEVVYDQRSAAEAASVWCRSVWPQSSPQIVFCRAADWAPTRDEIAEQVEQSLQARVDLPSGGEIVVEQTQALTVVDINSRSASSGQADANSERVLLRANLAAADEIARQIRLRNIGGIVVVDFIDLKGRPHRRQVVDRLRAACERDSASIWVGAMSRLGLVELTRKRRGSTLLQTMTGVCSTCDGTGRVRRVLDLA